MLITGKQYAYKLITYFKNVIIKMYDLVIIIMLIKFYFMVLSLSYHRNAV